LAGAPAGAEGIKKSPGDNKTAKIKLKLGDGKAKPISVTLGQSAIEVYNLCRPVKVYADDDPWLICLADGGGTYVFFFCAEGAAEEIRGRLDPRRDKLYAVLRYPTESRDNGKFVLPGSMRDKTYGDFVTLKVPLGADRAKVASVALGMSAQEVKHLFPSAPDHADENHAVVYDSAYNGCKYLLIFTPQDDGNTRDPKLDKLSEVIYRLGSKAEPIYLLPRNKRGRPAAAKHRELLGIGGSKSGAGKSDAGNGK
jgi:hypothetical protein